MMYVQVFHWMGKGKEVYLKLIIFFFLEIMQANVTFKIEDNSG